MTDHAPRPPCSHRRRDERPVRRLQGAPDGGATIGHYEAQGAVCRDCGAPLVNLTTHTLWTGWRVVTDLSNAETVALRTGLTEQATQGGPERHARRAEHVPAVPKRRPAA